MKSIEIIERKMTRIKDTKGSSARRELTPPATHTSVKVNYSQYSNRKIEQNQPASPVIKLLHARWMATNDDEHPVSSDTAGPFGKL